MTTCLNCGCSFEASRSDAKACSPRCKKALQRLLKRRFPKSPATLRDIENAHLVAVYRDDLKEMGFKPRPRLPDRATRIERGDKMSDIFPHRATVKFKDPITSRFLPGLINWFSAEGSMLLRTQNRSSVPIDSLMGLQMVDIQHVDLVG